MKPTIEEIEQKGNVKFVDVKHAGVLKEGGHGAAAPPSLSATGEFHEFSKDLAKVTNQLNAHRADFEAETGRSVPGHGICTAFGVPPQKKGKSKSFSVTVSSSSASASPCSLAAWLELPKGGVSSPDCCPDLSLLSISVRLSPSAFGMPVTVIVCARRGPGFSAWAS